MRLIVLPVGILSLLGPVRYSAAFQSHRAFSNKLSGTPLSSSYLESLSEFSPPSESAPPSYVPSNSDDTNEATSPPSAFTHASAEFFDVSNLAPKGPRPTADWGQPNCGDASRKLADDGMLSAGSWWCSKGGWPSPNEKGATEFFYMISGHGCLSDADGVQHFFGPGDTVVIPKGHTGRWDVFEDIHKVWAVNAHEFVEERSTPVRVVVEHYKDYFGCLAKDSALEGGASLTLYDVGPTTVGSWMCQPGSCAITKDKRSFFYLVEGVMFVTDNDGNARRCVAGDTVVLPQHWTGYFDVVETAKKIWVEVE